MIAPPTALRYAAPSAALAPYVSVLFLWTGGGGPVAGWFPAIEGQIAIRLTGEGRFTIGGRLLAPPPPVALIGPLTGAVHLATSPAMRSIGAGLTAAGWRLIAGIAPGALRDGIGDLADLWGPAEADALHAELLGEADDDRCFAALDRALVARAARARADDDWRPAAIDGWLADDALLTLATLAHRLDLSTRQIERLTLATHGQPPKLLAMKHRALRAALKLATARPRSIAEAGYGYSDQSHMIRDFRRFIGTTPQSFLRAPVARHVFEEPERVGASLAHRRA